MIPWILENTIVVALFAGLLLIVDRLLRSRPAVCHLLWVLALFLLVTPRLPLPLRASESLRVEIQSLLRDTDVKGVSEPVLAERDSAPERRTSSPVGATAELGELDEANWGATATADGGERAAVEAPAWYASVTLETWGWALWALGALALLARSGVRILAFQRLVRRASAAPAHLLDEVEVVARRLGVRAPRVRLLAGVGSPSIWCLGRPVLLWPAELEAARAEATFATHGSTARSTLIAHELAHLARRDHWLAWLEVPAAAALWWNPLFWLIRGRFRHFAELACDAWAVWAYPAERRAFAEALIQLHARTATAPIALQGLGATDSELRDFERRLDMIMKKRVTPVVSRGAAAVAVLAAVLAAPGSAEDRAFDGASKKKGAEAVEASADAKPAPVLTYVESKRAFETAEELFDAKKFTEALTAYEAALALDPDHGMAHARAGYLRIGAGEYADAEEHFQRQYELGERPPTALYNIGCARALSGDGEGALDYVDAALKHGFARTELLKKDTDLASIRSDERFTAIVQRAERADVLRRELARLEGAGDELAFLATHAELVELVSKDGALVSEHGHLALKAGDYEHAARTFGRQAKLGFKTPTALYNRACALSLAGEREKALADLKKSAELGMSFAGVRTDTDLDALRDDWRFEELEERIAAPALEQKQLSYSIESGDLATAVPALRALAEDETQSKKSRTWAALALGRLLIDDGRFDESLGALGTSAALGMAVDDSAFQMARAYAGLGRADDALRYVEHAVDLGYADAVAVGELLRTKALGSDEARAKLVERASASKSNWAKEGKDGYAKKKAWQPAAAKKGYSWAGSEGDA